MDQNRIKRNQMLGAKIVKELTARNMEAYYTDSKEEALKKALELIPEGSSISWGGSMCKCDHGRWNYDQYRWTFQPCILYRCRTTECVDDHRNE